MSEENLVWPSWSVDLPGLTEENAEEIVEWARARNIAFGPSVVDPNYAYTMHADFSTIEGLLAACEIALSAAVLSPQMSMVVQGMQESFSEWLSGKVDPSE